MAAAMDCVCAELEAEFKAANLLRAPELGRVLFDLVRRVRPVIEYMDTLNSMSKQYILSDLRIRNNGRYDRP